MAGCPIVHFDHHDETFHQRRLEEWAALRETPVAFNQRHGGFWVVSGYDEVVAVSRDSASFSSRYEPEPIDGIDYVGALGLPRTARALGIGLAEVEETWHGALRRVVNPFLSAGLIAERRASMQRYASWFLDRHIASGRIDLVKDFAGPVSAVLTMDLVGLPAEKWQDYAEMFQASRAYEPGSEQAMGLKDVMDALAAELIDEIQKRRARPGDDLLSALVGLELAGGRRLTDDELIGQMWFIIGGGLDTTTATAALSLHHLATHPELRKQLLEQPDLLPMATEEFLRFFAVNETLTRTVTRDVVLAGQQMHRGEHLMVSWLSANRDASVFADPDQVILDRTPNPHLTFGLGSHRCVGMHAARALFQVLVGEVLSRIPDYELDAAGMVASRPNPIINSVASLPVRFSPSPGSGRPQPF